MPDPSLHTTQLHAWLARYQAGDRAAADELVRNTAGRLERLARKMLVAYPNVRCWVDADDVLQNALLRLLHSLRQLQPDSVRAFFGLATEHLRRELLDLARHFHGARGIGANQASPVGTSSPTAVEPVDVGDDPGELEQWCRFHEEVERLPAEEREVVGLIFYHGWEQAEVAELFGVSVRTVQRRWSAAMAKLHRLVRSNSGRGK